MTPLPFSAFHLEALVIVHDDMRPCFRVAEELNDRHVVRIACTLPEIGTELGLVERLACIVCIPGRKLRAHDVHDEAVHLGVAPERILFVDLETIGHPDVMEDSIRTIDSLLSRIAAVAAVVAATVPKPRPTKMRGAVAKTCEAAPIEDGRPRALPEPQRVASRI